MVCNMGKEGVDSSDLLPAHISQAAVANRLQLTGRTPPIAGRKLYRINLSEQTDIMDLLGADLPVQGGAPGAFAWWGFRGSLSPDCTQWTHQIDMLMYGIQTVCSIEQPSRCDHCSRV
jgi:hypothetical protein